MTKLPALVSAVLLVAFGLSGCRAGDEFAKHTSMADTDKVKQLRSPDPIVKLQPTQRVTGDLDRGSVKHVLALDPYSVVFNYYVNKDAKPQEWKSTDQPVINYSVELTGLKDARKVKLSTIKITCDIEGQKVEAASDSGDWVLAPNYLNSFTLPGFKTEKNMVVVVCQISVQLAIEQDAGNGQYVRRAAIDSIKIPVNPVKIGD